MAIHTDHVNIHKHAGVQIDAGITQGTSMPQKGEDRSNLFACAPSGDADVDLAKTIDVDGVLLPLLQPTLHTSTLRGNLQSVTSGESTRNGVG